MEALCHRVQSGDSILVESGKLHAIDAGDILEIQQNSDTTYRVYDWEDLAWTDGKSLHIKESMQCIDFGSSRPMTTMIEEGMEVISDSIISH